VLVAYPISSYTVVRGGVPAVRGGVPAVRGGVPAVRGGVILLNINLTGITVTGKHL
jgi:hypothetical protein